ncbi:hypothetical protein KR032_001798 [Drosophila birchii]|nr:hypothetical protein KR032_001798 [Drosophila birchii]
MANTFRVNWLKKLLNSYTSTRKYRSMDDTHAIGSTMDITILNGLRKVPSLPEQPHSSSMASDSVRFHKCPTANAVKSHPVIRNLNIANKQKKRSLSLACCQKRRRNEQLAKKLGSQASSTHSRPIPLKIVAMRKLKDTQHPNHHRVGWQDVRDSVVIRNIEKIVRESQVKSRNRQAKPAIDKDKPMKGLAKKSIGLVNITSQEKHYDKDIRFSRLSSKLAYNAKRLASSSSTDDPSRGHLPGRPAYNMRITHVKVRFVIKRNHRKRSKDSTKIKTKTKSKTQSIEPNPATSKLVQEEQKRLDILRAEWVQLKGLENVAKYKKSLQTGELNKSKDMKSGTKTDLDLNTLIVDPKSFLTKVHVKSKVFSVDYDDSLDPLENPINIPDPTKESADGSLPVVPH